MLISPAITILDRAVVERTTTGRPLIRGLVSQLRSAIRRPRGFFLTRPLGIVWTLYAATYVTANAATTVAERYEGAAAVGTATFASTLLVNVPLGVWKDLRFAEIFGSGASLEAGKAVTTTTAPRGLPRAATATFLLRDAVTIFGSFTLPGWVSSTIPDSVMVSSHAKTTITQLTVPVLSQLVASPIHLIALDYYERQTRLPFSDRVARTRGHVPSTVVMRCVRIIPAFGIGSSARGLVYGVFQQRQSFDCLLAACVNPGFGSGVETWNTVFWIATRISIAVGLIRICFPESKQLLEAKTHHVKNTASLCPT
ncbi:major facilitator superfamily transporter [Colletotrichum higginsianum IMI 349063]|uniref:Major facilitator superfamily transporter n=2 Tax=Colletotrichum higginsianum TaxID=80884 RepID=A0A1B7Y323_COLHI|nr:major facilitator superfamily transporter [Colletotrichum higginsianum IMI 349063]OBR06406.1 major facilitator superfamily transporter [Colletotrichum higginsianum IMI 349063]TIC97653.1 putative membrane protein [Colletotrichum higginsianum]